MIVQLYLEYTSFDRTNSGNYIMECEIATAILQKSYHSCTLGKVFHIFSEK